MSNIIRFLATIAIMFWYCAAFGQSNCSYITYLLTSDTKTIGTSCDTHFNEPVNETQAYDVQCVDQTNNDNVYMDVTSQMSSTGQTSAFCGGPSPIDCSPIFQPQGVNAGFTSAGDDINRFYLRVWPRTDSGTKCSQGPMSQDLKQCYAVACDTGGGGSDCTDPTIECLGSPIVIDVETEGFHLTSAAAGVVFDIKGNDHPVRIAWTNAHYHNAFLVLPAPDGLVHSGKQLFGNFTAQPQSSHPNGFVALAQYDKPENGGNGDGVIDDNDAVFPLLRLWIDENHDGISQPKELHSLSEFGVSSLALRYSESPRTDQFGNEFRYKAQVDPGTQKDVRDQTASGRPGRWMYDVFLVIK
jgi:hypothetical protein